MATALVLGEIEDVTLGAASAVEQLTGIAQAKWLILYPPASGDQLVDVAIVTRSGGSVAADGRWVPKETIDLGGYPFDISPYGFVGLAGSAAGSVRVEVRS